MLPTKPSTPPASIEAAPESTAPEQPPLPELPSGSAELHPLVDELLVQLRAYGDFTPELWQRLYGAMDELSDDDLDTILRAVGDSSERRRASRS